MTPEKQRIAIAEACGWRTQREMWPSGERITWLAPYRVPGYLGAYSPPDYLNDLNAMHEAEKALTHKQCIEYYSTLGSIQAYEVETIFADGNEFDYPAFEFWFHASASQRAEAFLKTLNLWEAE